MKKLVTLLTLLLSFSASNAQWTSLGNGLNAEARALQFYNGELYAGGMFTTAGDTTANYIAKWNGSEWQPVGGGMNGPVLAFTIYQGDLYVGGDFTQAGNIPAKKIAKWNGADWDSVGTGMNDSGFVASMAVYNNELYVGGHFSEAGSLSPVNNIARWNGSTWATAGYGFSAQFFPMVIVKSLAVFEGELYAAGMFDHAETDYAIGIATWDGNLWSDINYGFNHEATSLMNYSGFLYVGGAFSSTASGNPMNKLTQWDGTNWEQIGTGVDTTVACMAVFRDKLYVGGYFSKANNMNANHLAVFDLGTFEPVVLGTDTAILSMVADSNALYMSGLFSTAGGISVNHIARYAGPSDVKEIKSVPLKVQPNPTNGLITINGGDLRGADFTVYDVCGKAIISERVSGLTHTADLSASPDGVYIVRVISEGKEISVSRIVKGL